MWLWNNIQTFLCMLISYSGGLIQGWRAHLGQGRFVLKSIFKHGSNMEMILIGKILR